MSNPQIILCPGQGAQHVGMGKAWAERFPVAAQTFAEADKELGYALSKLCFEGPEDDLNKTDRAQVAIYVTSVACHRSLKEQGKLGTMVAAAGLSLGEFTALHLGGAFDFLSGLRLVKLRGEAMQEAAEASPSSMVALVGADEHQAAELCRKTLEVTGDSEVLVPANYNCPGQIVISGSKAACEVALKVAEEMTLRATALKVAGAFHSPLMQPAADRLKAALDKTQWFGLHCPVLSNVTATPHDGDIKLIKQRLVEQLTSPVRWSSCMQWAIANLPGQFVELAPGKVLSGLMRRIDKATKVENHAEPTA
ncbi:MAG: ACP S-malonyltransferase [Phycisphaeraceae bacterium]